MLPTTIDLRLRTTVGPRLPTIVGPRLRTIFGPRLRTIFGPRLRTTFDLRLRTIVGPRLRTIVGPRLRTIVGPRLRTIVGPRLPTIVGPRLPTIVGPRLRTIVGPRLPTIVGPRLLATFDLRRSLPHRRPRPGGGRAPSGRSRPPGASPPAGGWAAVVLVGLFVAGCGFQPAPGSRETSRSAGGSPVASGPAGSLSSSGPAGSLSSSGPAGSLSASACPIEPTSGRLVSNRLLGVAVDPAGMWVRFQFGSPTGSPGQGSLEAATPPFDRTSSGQALQVVGERVVRLHFDGLLLFDELGNATYGGPDRLRPVGGPIRDVVVEEAFEGVMNWLVGFDGPGCIRLRQGLDPLSLELVIAPTE